MLRKVPLFWIVCLALLATSAIPLSVMAYSSISTTERSVEAEQANQLKARVEAYASTIEQKLKNFSSATQLAAAEAHQLLTQRDKLTMSRLTNALKNMSATKTTFTVWITGMKLSLSRSSKQIVFQMLSSIKTQSLLLN